MREYQPVELSTIQAKTIMTTEMIMKRVARFDHWMGASFAERLAREADIDLRVMALQGDAALAWVTLKDTHVYQITAARNELPQQYQVTAAFLEHCPGLLCVSSGGAGFDTVDVPACTAAGVAVMSQIGGNANAVAEMAIGLMLAVSRRIVESDRKLRSERGFTRESLMGHDISGKTLGLVGLGHTGTRTAQFAKAFGMTVLASDPLLSEQAIRDKGAEPVSLDRLVQQADIISVHCPLEASTANLFDSAQFSAMKQGAIFISTARGGIHNEQALELALRSGHLAGAGLDVWETEPPALQHPLLALANVVATFHTAGVSHEGRGTVASMAAEQIVGLFHGVKPPRLVNPEVWDLFKRRYQQAFSRSWGQE
jgi:D-3-phosphoglycerate dehydrogenase / 2-oxoglutarate reductase